MRFRAIPFHARSATSAGFGALDPIAGVSLERYAEMRVEIAFHGDDPEVFAKIALQHGADRASWERADAGWAMRMEDPSTSQIVVGAYVPLYRAAMSRRRAVRNELEDRIRSAGDEPAPNLDVERRESPPT